MRQPVCETEIVPSLHSNLGTVSATGGGIDAAAVCCGAGASATGFGDKAQPAHRSRIDKAKPIRIRAASGKAPAAADGVDLVARQSAATRVQATTAPHDSNITGARISRQLDGSCCYTNGNKAGANVGTAAALCCVQRRTKTASRTAHRAAMSTGFKGIDRYRRSAGGVPAFGKRNKAPGGLVVVGGA